MNKIIRNMGSELGRGIVEMMGVLAIMGVLSIVSVFAYRRAMDKTLTVEIVNTLAQRAIIAASQKESGSEVNLEEFAEDTYTKQYNITYQDEDDEFFSITMENVPDEIVQGIASMKWKIPYNIYVNGIQIDDYDFSKKLPKTSFAVFYVKPAYADETSNQLKFIFHKKLEAYEKHPYMDPETCTGTGGRWDGRRCFCDGKDMTASGCKSCKPYLEDGISKCGQGETQDEDDEDVICYRDSECRGCLEICDNGKCVLDEDDECDGNHYWCEGKQIVSCIKTGSKDTSCATQKPVIENCGEDRICSMASGKAECVNPTNCDVGYFKAESSDECIPCSEIRQEGEYSWFADAKVSDCESCPNIDIINISGNEYCAPKCGTGHKRNKNGLCEKVG